MIFHSKKEIASKKLLMILSSTLTLCVLSSFSIPLASAQTTVNNPSQNDSNSQYTLLEPLPCVPGNGVNCVAGTLQKKIDFGTYVQYIFNLIIAISAVAAVLVIVAGGFKYMTTDSFGGKDEGKKMITEALKGLLLVLCSFLILRTIDPRLVSIPSTIVKPLDVKYDPSATYGFFEQLAQEANKYHVNMDQYHQDVQASQTKITNLQKTKEDVLQQIQEKIKSGLTYEDPEVKNLGKMVDSLNDQINAEQGSIKLTFAKGSFDRIVYEYSPSTGVSGSIVGGVSGRDFKSALQRLETTYSDQKSALQKAGAQPDQIAALDNYKNYTEAAIIINEQVALINDVQSKYFDQQGDISRFVGGIGDNTLGKVLVIPNTPLDWITYSPQEYKKDFLDVTEKARGVINTTISTYSSKISDPNLTKQITQQAVDIQKSMRADLTKLPK